MSNVFNRKAWWARQGLNLRPLRCEHSRCCREAQKTAKFHHRHAGTASEHAVNRGTAYRSFTARVAA